MGLVVVTGAAGFLGSHVCSALLDRGWRVRGVDAFTRSYDPFLKRDNVADLLSRDDFELVTADLVTADLGPVLAGVDAVAHLAGDAGTPGRWDEGLGRCVETNVVATERLLGALARHDVGRLVHLSSSSVYGELPADGPVPRGLNPYGATKSAAEHLVTALGAARGIETVVLRCFSAYGPRQRPDMAVSRFVAALLDGRPVPVHGDGTQERDLVHARDVADAVVAALAPEVAPGTVADVATGVGVRVDELLALLAELLLVDAPVVERRPPRPGERRRAVAGPGCAGPLPGWAPRVDLSAGLAGQVAWQRERHARPLLRAVQPRRAGSVAPVRREPPRLLIYSQDGLGLGHLRRTTVLATEFLAARPGASALTVSDSPLGRFFAAAPDHDYVKLPSIRKAGPGDWHPVALSVPFRDVLELRRDLLRSTVTSFRPDVVLVDHMPHGAMGELIPALEALRATSSRVVLGLRDILDAPDVVRRRWAVEGAYEAVEQHYDEVLVYGSREVFDVTEQYAWPDAAKALVHYCGYVSSPPVVRGVDRLRRRALAGRPQARHVVAMAGGGADAHPLFGALLDALPVVDAARPVVVTMVTGPFMASRLRRDLAARARGLPVRLHETVPDALSHLASADLVVAMAGYNTTTEILQLGRPALLVPRDGPSAEQRTRARLFAERGWVRWLEPEALESGGLADAVLSGLGGPAPVPAAEPPLDGRSEAVARLLALLDLPVERSPRPHPVASAAGDR